MNYFDVKEKFLQSELAMLIVDKWVTGIPFFMEDENGIYDAFLYYSDNRKTAQFYSVKMLVVADVLTGETKCLTDTLSSFNIANNFTFETNPFTDIDEYLVLVNRIQEAYVNLRNSYVSTHIFDRTLQELYLQLVKRMIPKQIIEKVYKPLSPGLFMEK